jgi:hypothetical protein
VTLTLEQLYELVAQECHAAIGFAFTLALYLFPRPDMLWGIVVLMGVVAVKEAFVDPRTEPHEPPYPNGLTDWLFYLPGIALAVGLLVLAHRPL